MRTKDWQKRLASILNKLGMINIWDKAIQPGELFKDEIQSMITRSHIFMPLLTEESVKHVWIHQETGYAIAANIPQIPIAIENEVPTGMLSDIQAIVTDREFMNLSRKLTGQKLMRLVLKHANPKKHCLSYVKNRKSRSKYIADCIYEIIELQKNKSYLRSPVRIYERAALSSFSIPKNNCRSPIWKKYEGKVKRSNEYRRDLARQRTGLEKLAKKNGCDLVISPSIRLSVKGETARISRLKILLKYIEGTKADIRVKTMDNISSYNVLIVGDWFMVNARSRGQRVGYDDNYFTWHAPSILRALISFKRKYFRMGLNPPINSSLLCKQDKARNERTIAPALREIDDYLY